MKISVGILNWNTAHILHRSLDVLNEELKNVLHEVIVIDQGSIDDSINVVCDKQSSWNNRGDLYILVNEANIGISRGKNQCIHATDGDYLLLIDGDIIPVPNSILLMAEFLENNPDKHAIGMYPNRWTEQENKQGQKFYETYCETLYEPKEHNGACLFYGMYRRSLFNEGLKCCVEGELGEPGYGWEDHDFFFEMKRRGIKQYVAHINNPQGHYFHAINSSLKNKDCLGKQHYQDHYHARKAVFDRRRSVAP